VLVVDDTEQLSEEWFKLKAGIPGASSFDKIVTTKGEPSKQSKKYMYQLAGEAIVGEKTEGYSNPTMQRGIALESEARELFKLINGVEVKEVGMCFPDERRRYLCSPDGLLSDSGLEIKCPLIHTHVEYLLGNSLPTDYIQQVQGSMFITGFESWWFLSYYPGLPPLILRIKRDEKFIARLKEELERFCWDLSLMIKKLKEIQT
jgi:putative phage-type endonuclease